MPVRHAGLDKPAPAGSKPGASRNLYFTISWVPPGLDPGSAGMTSRSATIINLLRLKARGFNHPRKGH